MIHRLIDGLRRLLQRLARFFGRRRAHRVRSDLRLGGRREPAEYARGLPWLPRGDGRPFNPQDSRLLKTLQRRATYALFAELGQKWVPAEIFRILDAEALPSKALETFCCAFGLRIEALQRGAEEETVRLTHCIDLLFCVSDIGARLPAAPREDIVAAIRDGDYDAAAHRIDVCRLALRAGDDAADLERQMPFPQVKEFAASVRSFSDNWLRLSMDDVQAALATCRRYRALNDRFDLAVARLDAQIEWLSKNWPGNRWGRGNRDARDRMIDARRRLEQEVRTATAWDMERLELAIADLELLADDFAALAAEMHGNGRYRKRAWHERWDAQRRSDDVTVWVWALEALGLDQHTHPDPAAVRTAFCRQAMRYHPDRNADEPDAVQRYCRTRFEEAARARDILDRGAPLEIVAARDMAALPPLELSA